jgi:hypothetical protein
MTAKEAGSTNTALDTEFSDGLVGFCRTFRAQPLAAETVRRSTDAITDTLACMVLGVDQALEPKLRRALFSNQPLQQMLAEFAPVVLRVSSTDAQGSACVRQRARAFN